MKTNVIRRVAVAGGGVLALVAITSGALAIGGGTSDSQAPGIGAPDRYVAAAEQEPATPESKTAGSRLCPGDDVPDLTVERFPDVKTPGAATVLEAIQEIVPTATTDNVIETPFGPVDKGAPVWVETAGGTYVVVQAPAGGWFASAATQNGCGLGGAKQLPLPD